MVVQKYILLFHVYDLQGLVFTFKSLENKFFFIIYAAMGFVKTFQFWNILKK